MFFRTLSDRFSAAEKLSSFGDVPGRLLVDGMGDEACRSTKESNIKARLGSVEACAINRNFDASIFYSNIIENSL